MGKIKERERMLLDFIDGFWDENGHSPTIMEIVEGTGMPRATVSDYLQYMRDDGLITATGHRNIMTKRSQSEGGTVRVPVYGVPMTGHPLLREKNVIEYVKLPLSLFGGGELFVLRAGDGNMSRAGIEAGDYMVVRKGNEAAPGRVVLVQTDRTLIVARYYPLVGGAVRLEPESGAPGASAVVVEIGTGKEAVLLGTVIKTIRNVI